MSKGKCNRCDGSGQMTVPGRPTSSGVVGLPTFRLAPCSDCMGTGRDSGVEALRAENERLRLDRDALERERAEVCALLGCEDELQHFVKKIIQERDKLAEDYGGLYLNFKKVKRELDEAQAEVLEVRKLVRDVNSEGEDTIVSWMEEVKRLRKEIGFTAERLVVAEHEVKRLNAEIKRLQEWIVQRRPTVTCDHNTGGGGTENRPAPSWGQLEPNDDCGECVPCKARAALAGEKR